MSMHCPICNELLTDSRVAQNNCDSVVYDCRRCGTYELDNRMAKTALPDLLKQKRYAQALLSHAVRMMQRHETQPSVLDTDLISKILERTFPSPEQQANTLLWWISENTEVPGEYVDIDDPMLQALVGAQTKAAFDFALQHLCNAKVIEVSDSLGKIDQARVTFAGWARYDELRRGASSSKTAFMAMPFDDHLLNEIVSKHFKPAVLSTGFTLERADDDPQAGSIDDRIRVKILNARFVVADLTNGNNGVYWEAGYAEGLGKPVIYTCEKGYFEKEKTHFDTNHLHTVTWTDATITSDCERLKSSIRATLPSDAKMRDDEGQGGI